MPPRLFLIDSDFYFNFYSFSSTIMMSERFKVIYLLAKERLEISGDGMVIVPAEDSETIESY